MKIGVIGGGVVGSATANCYRSHGHEVLVYDIDPDKRDVNSVAVCVHLADVVFICLPENNLEDVCGVLQRQGYQDRNYVLKSTVPVGTTRRLVRTYDLRNIVHSPEFLSERTANRDAYNPRVSIIGYPLGYPGETGKVGLRCPIYDLYRSTFGMAPIRWMTSDESEAVKLFTNVFFAEKVAIFNEFRRLADKLGLSWETVVGGMLADGRISSQHTKVPGPDGAMGFGGRCLPKDLDAFITQYFEHPDLQAPVMAMAAVMRNVGDRKESV